MKRAFNWRGNLHFYRDEFITLSFVFSVISYMLRDALPMPRSVKYIISPIFAFCIEPFMLEYKARGGFIVLPKGQSLSKLLLDNLAPLFYEGPFALHFVTAGVRLCFRISLLCHS